VNVSGIRQEETSERGEGNQSVEVADLDKINSIGKTNTCE
jgi:hypothetical protein